MSYVDAFYNKKKDIVHVCERVDGKRVLSEFVPDYTFYINDENGNKRSIYNETVSEIQSPNRKQFYINLGINKHRKTYESDTKPVNRILEKHFLNAKPPKLQTAFFDIEVDFDPDKGYSAADTAFTPITAIGIYLDWMESMICLAIRPKTLSIIQAQEMVKHLPEVILCKTEAEMLDIFLTVIEDADILSGWNSESYDIPYLYNRIVKTLGKSETSRLCLWNEQPEKRTFDNKHGTKTTTYDLRGRVHLDYMNLYIKYNYDERHSYRLDYIGEMEIGEKKVAYEGSLDSLYKYDFLKFIEYNIQDTLLLYKLDKKLQFIDLANVIAHENTVLLPLTMGTVAMTEQAILNEAHRRNLVIPDRKRSRKTDESFRAAGAYVTNPKKGLHDWVSTVDINSLYPSLIRALNMAPETVVGQLRAERTDAEIDEKINFEKKSFAEAWADKFCSNEFQYVMDKDDIHKMHLDLADGSEYKVTGAEVYNLVFNSGNPWNISANGTIFTREFQGIVPGLLERWYKERQEMQKTKKQWQQLRDGIEIPDRLKT